MKKESYLFDIGPYLGGEVPKKFISADNPLWTRNKARFIARYLKTFTYVTKHGTYIDAFAGPQHEETSEESWAAKLVMENTPSRLRNFYLFDKGPKQIGHLKGLRTKYLETVERPKSKRVEITRGDCNATLPRFLEENPIKENEATFCLLDQRSTECDWATVKAVAGHKGRNGGMKIEIFYFLAQGWIDRGIKSWRSTAEEKRLKFWGKDGLDRFLRLNCQERGIAMAARFKEELGYKYSYPYPIQKEGESGRVMFWMIHASDHPRATDLMWQAYRHIGAGGGLNDPIEQTELDGLVFES
ncbi:three-Cys-motif partner protein TcmP [Pelagicoccus sp. NFK12]|uniref:Three-Cys-motif partner protein TcmP n=1 Tax=Pelagicoccus enzymogenes TaxID=2773457 RepID=A0A927IJK8_9BACT|nr:three-Cys-motif partner protein TcmP [Pelagicoccus enzymogenes]MBD5781650.1 three-Cys-motif partner protein TcmP [Pelagicoccus enzymogenes]